MTKPRPVPDDLAEQARDKGKQDLMDHYHCSFAALERWLHETGVTPKHKVGSLPKAVRPPEFAGLVHGMSQIELCRHFNRSRDVISRWEREVGFDRKQAAAPKAKTPEVKRGAAPRWQASHQAARTAPERWSTADEAARHLRNDGWSNVHRCREDGKQDIAGKFWRCGNIICDEAELIRRGERAKAKRLAA